MTADRRFTSIYTTVRRPVAVLPFPCGGFSPPRPSLTADPHKKIRWTDSVHGPDNPQFRSASTAANPNGQPQMAAANQRNSL